MSGPERWGEMFDRRRGDYTPGEWDVCNICGAEWTQDTLVDWDETLGEYVCAHHIQEQS